MQCLSKLRNIFMFISCQTAPGPTVDLADATAKTPLFTLQGLETRAKCTKCYDADTVHLVFPYGDKLHRWTCRLLGIDSAEIRTTDLKEKEHATRARDYVRARILDKVVTVTCGKFDKYGRLLVTIYYEGVNLNEHLVAEGFAYEYTGKTKRQFREWSGIGEDTT
jgi:endonuclease YncB( thermonuclease family)